MDQVLRYRIGVLADSHDKIPLGLLDALRTADEIWHLGDVTSSATLASFQRLGKSLTVVRGNCDVEASWPLLEIRTIARAVRAQLIHIPPRQPEANVNLVLHGHTHVPRDETLGGIRYLNPGCVTRPNRGAPASFAWLEISSPGSYTWSLVPISSLNLPMASSEAA